jgi:hypothetical protein
MGVLGSGKLKLFHVLLALAPTLWVASSLVMFNEWRHLRTLWSGSWRQRLEAGLAVFLVALLCLAPPTLPWLSSQSMLAAIFLRADELFALPGFSTKFFILKMLTITVVMLHLSSMFGVHLQLAGQLRRSLAAGEEPEAERLAEDVQRYQQLRSRLERLLGFCAAIIGLSILITGAMRSLLKEVSPGPPELLAPGHVMAFGAYYTWLLALIYLPIRKTLQDVGHALAEGLMRQSLGKRVTWKQWHEERQALRTWLGLQGSALQELQQGLFVLVPLLAGISSLALGA